MNERRSFRMGPGAATLMLLAVVLSMSVLGILGLISARNDRSITVQSIRTAEQYAALSAQAQQHLAEADALLAEAARSADDEAACMALATELTDGTAFRWEDGLLCWTETDPAGRTLTCRIRPVFGENRRYVWQEHTYSGVPDGYDTDRWDESFWGE